MLITRLKIANGETDSEVINISGKTVTGIVFPAGSPTGNVWTFKSVIRRDKAQPITEESVTLTDEAGNNLGVTVAAGECAAIPPAWLLGHDSFFVTSNVAASGDEFYDVVLALI